MSEGPARESRLVLFASDNYAGVHPAVLAAIAAANGGFAPAYGDDDWTLALQERMREVFGDVDAFPVFNGTGGNVTALATVMRPFEAVICAETAHINVDECGAPERFAGCKLVDLPTADGKLTPDLVRGAVVGSGDQHHVQARVVSITQPTELGTVYTPAETAALAEVAHAAGLLLHVDGARLVNAAVGLGTGLREITTDCGVDVLTFGGTKNGLLGGEAVVFFRRDLAERYLFVRKQGMQLASKMRFVSAQLLRASRGRSVARDRRPRQRDGAAAGRGGGRGPRRARRLPGAGERRVRRPACRGHGAPARGLSFLHVGRAGGRGALDVLVADDARRTSTRSSPRCATPPPRDDAD